jgi:hypothetical protein
LALQKVRLFWAFLISYEILLAEALGPVVVREREAAE